MGYHAGLKAEGRWLMAGGGWHRGRLPESEPCLAVRRPAAWTVGLVVTACSHHEAGMAVGLWADGLVSERIDAGI